MRATDVLSPIESFKIEDNNVQEAMKVILLELNALHRLLAEISEIQSPLVGVDHVAKYFDKSPDTIRRWVKERVISCYKIPHDRGTTLLFSMKQIEDDLSSYASFSMG